MTVADARFQAFVRGAEIPLAAVREHLVAAGIDVPPARAVWGHRRKIGVVLEAGAGFVKLALHPLSVRLLRAEARAYASLPGALDYDVPRFDLVHDAGDWAAARMPILPGAAAGSWQALCRRPGPFERAASGDRPLVEHLAALAGAPSVSRWRGDLLRRHGECQAVGIGWSHGDFVYWNLLPRPGGRPVLIDLEYGDPGRSRSFDRIFWMLVPLGLAAVARGGARLLAWRARWLARHLAPPGEDGALALALALAEHAALIEAEHAEPDAVALFGQADLAVRRALLELYDAMMARLTGRA